MLEAKRLHKKGITKEGIARVIEGITWVAKEGAARGVIKWVVKEIVIDGAARDKEATKERAARGAVKENDCSKEKKVWNNPPRCCDLGDDKGEMTWVVGDDDPRWINS